jgi:hypothetical protein
MGWHSIPGVVANADDLQISRIGIHCDLSLCERAQGAGKKQGNYPEESDGRLQSQRSTGWFRSSCV